LKSWDGSIANDKGATDMDLLLEKKARGNFVEASHV